MLVIHSPQRFFRRNPFISRSCWKFPVPGNRSFYRLRISNYRGGLEFGFGRQYFGLEHLDRGIMQEPFQREFSRDELNETTAFLLEYLASYFDEHLSHYRGWN